jgi:hypothetical protein
VVPSKEVRKMKKKRFRNWWFGIYKIKYLYSYLRNRFVVKHHLIRTGLRPGWWDTDTRMLYGMMALLVEFIEKEKPEEIVEWDSASDHAHARDEFKAIYGWWKNYPKFQNEISDLLSKWHDCKFGKDYSHDWIKKLNIPDTKEAKRLFDNLNIAEQRLEEEEQDMLMRLVKIRHFLWT